MEKYFGSSYKGDPGIPHSGSHKFSSIWMGSFLFSAITWFDPYIWNVTNAYNWHDRAMLFEQYHWKQAVKKGKGDEYEFQWNKMDKAIRDSYYHNWPVYFK